MRGHDLAPAGDPADPARDGPGRRGSTEVFGGEHVVFVGPSDAVKTARDIFIEEVEAAS